MIIETAARNTLCDAAVDLIDVGTTDATGDLVFETAGDVEVAALTFANPAYGAAAAGVAQENAIASDASAAGGTIAQASIFNRDNTKVYELTVTAPLGGGEIEMTGGLVIGAGATVSCSDLPFTMPAS